MVWHRRASLDVVELLPGGAHLTVLITQVAPGIDPPAPVKTVR